MSTISLFAVIAPLELILPEDVMWVKEAVPSVTTKLPAAWTFDKLVPSPKVTLPAIILLALIIEAVTGT